MVNAGKKIVKYRVVILILGILLLIPSALGFLKTRVNYDILYYLPDNIDTMKGQNILMDEFGKGAFAMEVVEGMNTKDAAEVKEKIKSVDGVADVIWYDSIADTSMPIDILPDKLKDVFKTEDATLMAIFFDDTTSADSTMDAITEIRSVTNKQCYLSSMSAVVTDIKQLSEKETPIYVLIAVILSCIVLSVFMDCWMLPAAVHCRASAWQSSITWAPTYFRRRDILHHHGARLRCLQLGRYHGLLHLPVAQLLMRTCSITRDTKERGNGTCHCGNTFSSVVWAAP